jgi:hypothetical protein
MELPRFQAEVFSLFFFGASAVLPLPIDLSLHQQAERSTTVNKGLAKKAIPGVPVVIEHLM